MELRLDLGPQWVLAGEATARVYHHATLDLRLAITTSLPEGDAVSPSTTTSASGWTVDWVEQHVASSAGPEHRLHASYRILERVAVVTVAGPADQIAAHRSELEAVLLSGRPDWSGEVACLAQLFADVDLD